MIDPTNTLPCFNFAPITLYILADARFALSVVELDPKAEKVTPIFEVGKLPFNTTFLTPLIVSVNIVISEVFDRETTESEGVNDAGPDDSMSKTELIPVLYPLPPLLIVNVRAVEFSILDTIPSAKDPLVSPTNSKESPAILNTPPSNMV